MKTIRRQAFLLQALGTSTAGSLWLLCQTRNTVADESHSLKVTANDTSTPDADLLNQARRVHQAALIVDSHVDIFGTQYATPQLDPGVDNPELRCDLVKMAAGGVDGVFLAVYTGQGPRTAEGYSKIHDRALRLLEAIHRVPRQYPDRCELALSPNDVERIVHSGRRAIMIGMENGYPIGTDLANVEKFYYLGVRYITLSHNGHNQICDSCNPKAELGDKAGEHNGLSPFGRQVLAEMNRLGIMIDVSHIASTSLRDVLALSKAPVIASHSGCKAVYDHPRNLADDELRALAAGGGVVQVVTVPEFLKKPASDGTADATIEDFMDHLDHAVKVAGVDHVGIGSDFDGGGGAPGFDNHAERLNVTVALLQRGYSQTDIEKIWGGNLLRAWREVQKLGGG